MDLGSVPGGRVSSDLQQWSPKARATGQLTYIRLLVTAAPSSSSLEPLIMNYQWFPSGGGGRDGWPSECADGPSGAPWLHLVFM